VKNGPAAALAILSLMHRYCVVPFSPTDKADFIAARIASSRCVAIVTIAATPQEVEAAEAAKEAHVKMLALQLESTTGFLVPPPPCDAPLSPSLPLAAEATCLILHTSGTTGEPKRVPFSMSRLIKSGEVLAAALGLQPRETGLNMMPLHHVGGITTCIFAPLVAGGQMIFSPKFDPVEWLELVDSKRIAWSYLVPAMWTAVLEAGELIGPRSRPWLRVLRNAGAGLPHDLALRLAAMFPQTTILPTYGMTECMPIAAPPLGYKLQRPESVGPPLANMRIVSREVLRGGASVAPGTVGEIALFGLGEEQLFPGYEDAEGTVVLPADGFFRTGDLGKVDEDGWLYVVGRCKEVVNRGGEIISPLEVEQVINAHPLVRECMCFAVPHDVLEEVVGVALPADSLVDLEHIRRWCAQRLHGPMLPAFLLLVDELPRTAGTGKLMRSGFAHKVGLPPLSGPETATQQLKSGTPPKLVEPSVDAARVEDALQQSLEVLDARVVTLMEEGVSVALVSPQHVDCHTLRAMLSTRLPEHSLPKHVVAVDTESLKAPEESARKHIPHLIDEAPTTVTTQVDSLSRVLHEAGKKTPEDYVMMSHMYWLAMYGIIYHHVELSIWNLNIPKGAYSYVPPDLRSINLIYMMIDGVALPSFTFLAGLNDVRYPQTHWKGAVRKIVLGLVLGFLLKLPNVWGAGDISWLILNLCVYRAIYLPFQLVQHRLPASADVVYTVAVALITFGVHMTCKATDCPWPLALNDDFRGVYSGKLLANYWIYYALFPRIIPSSAFRPMTKGWWALCGKKFERVASLRLVAFTLAVLSALFLGLMYHEWRDWSGVHGMNDRSTNLWASTLALSLCFLFIVSSGHMFPGSPTLLSLAGECSYMCLLLHWSLLNGPVASFGPEPWDQLHLILVHLSMPSFLITLADVLIFAGFCLALQLACSFSLTLTQPVKPFRWPIHLCSKLLCVRSNSSFERLSALTCRFPVFHAPIPRATALSWLILLLFGFIGPLKWPQASTPANSTNAQSSLADVSTWRSASTGVLGHSLQPALLPY